MGQSAAETVHPAAGDPEAYELYLNASYLANSRKEADLDYADRIRIRYRAADELAEAIQTFSEWIARETLAVEIEAAAAGSPGLVDRPVEDLDFELAIERVERQTTGNQE